jgi:AmiR/NasT family two-component response regulator
MGSHRVNAATAFDILRHRSQRENRKLRDIAAEIVDDATRGDA